MCCTPPLFPAAGQGPTRHPAWPVTSNLFLHHATFAVRICSMQAHTRTHLQVHDAPPLRLQLLGRLLEASLRRCPLRRLTLRLRLRRAGRHAKKGFRLLALHKAGMPGPVCRWGQYGAHTGRDCRRQTAEAGSRQTGGTAWRDVARGIAWQQAGRVYGFSGVCCSALAWPALRCPATRRYVWGEACQRPPAGWPHGCAATPAAGPPPYSEPQRLHAAPPRHPPAPAGQAQQVVGARWLGAGGWGQVVGGWG